MAYLRILHVSVLNFLIQIAFTIDILQNNFGIQYNIDTVYQNFVLVW